MVYKKMKLYMMCSVWSKVSFVLILLFMACTKETSQVNRELENKINAVPQFAIIDLDRCNSCFSEYADRLNLSANDTSTLVIVLSNSKKKAMLFGNENKIKVLWDSTRYFENYLEKSSHYFQTNPSVK
ncbi:hypothetical protein B879_01195 [Cecembia lonarensis LW9]|uniref:Lipoprotein n=2 Tax=Cecembia TaxID=1187078 RepID=K1L1D3_CECL9|nr:hypothetical protein B879_01195 [Cecembia lonarensis LW9]